MFSLVYQLHMPLTKLKFEELGTNLGLGPFKNRGIYDIASAELNIVFN